MTNKHTPVRLAIAIEGVPNSFMHRIFYNIQTDKSNQWLHIVEQFRWETVGIRIHDFHTTNTTKTMEKMANLFGIPIPTRNSDYGLYY